MKNPGFVSQMRVYKSLIFAGISVFSVSREYIVGGKYDNLKSDYWSGLAYLFGLELLKCLKRVTLLRYIL